MHISKLFCQVNPQSLCKRKTYIHKHQTQIFEELVPSVLPLLKEHIRPGHAGIINHSNLLMIKKWTEKKIMLHNA